MKYLSIVVLMLIIGCSTQKQILNPSSLNSVQVKSGGPGRGEPNKCYQKMKNETGEVEWYEIICPSRTREYKLAYDCLKKLGYKLIDNTTFKMANGNALIDFQQNEGLAAGALDEATLRLLILKSQK